MTEMFDNCCTLILASSSPRRQQFLHELGLQYRIICPDGVEPLPDTGENPMDYVKRAALCKAQHVYNMLLDKEQEYLVLAADTVVCLQGQILGKPKNTAHALKMLKLLAGQEHEVISAVSIMGKGDNFGSKQICFSDSTKVVFHAWSEQMLAAYANTGECLDKAGAYAIQGQGAFLVKSIFGSWSTVVGLPVGMLVECLLKHDFIRVRD